MAFFEFQSVETGEKRDFEFPMGACPVRIGAEMVVNGARWARLMPNFTAGAPSRPSLRDRRVVSYSLPRYHPDAPRVDQHGRALFDGRREIREFQARQDGQYVYDGR